MKVFEAARRSTVAVGPDCTIHEAAHIMDASLVGALVILDNAAIVGIVTDRDIVRRAVAGGLPLDGRIDAIMTTDVVTIDADADVHDAFAVFRTHAVRRLPAVRGGKFVAMITVDDVLVDLAAELSDLTKPVAAEVFFGHRDAPVPTPA